MFRKIVLKNGLRIITFPMENTRAVTFLLLVATGSKYEKKKQNGISHLIEHMFFKGTKNRPTTLDIAKELDRVGGVYNAFTDKEFMGFWVKINSSHFDLAVDILSDMIFNPLFKKEEIEKEKQVIFEEINMMKDSPQSYIWDLWEKLLYGNQPAGWPIAGEKETVKKISRKDILDYFKKQFGTTNSVISLAGNINEKEAISKIQEFFSKYKKTSPLLKRKTKEFQESPRVLVHFKDTDQTHLCLGVRTFDIFQPKCYPLAVMSVILGGIMSSRLFIQVREKRGLAYYIHTFAKHYSDTGYLVTHAGIDNKRVTKAIEIILREYKKLKTKKVSKEELKKAKENIKGRLYLGLETSDSWANYWGSREILRREMLSPKQECEKIDKVTQDDILKVAKEIFVPSKLNLALIGPFKEKRKFKKLLKL
jgi:predicted Zn-dependent peptidase